MSSNNHNNKDSEKDSRKHNYKNERIVQYLESPMYRVVKGRVVAASNAIGVDECLGGSTRLVFASIKNSKSILSWMEKFKWIFS